MQLLPGNFICSTSLSMTKVNSSHNTGTTTTFGLHATTLHDSSNLPVKEFHHLSDFSELKI